jgi:hypothetical protein
MTHDYEDFSVSKMSDYWRVMEHEQLGVTTVLFNKEITRPRSVTEQTRSEFSYELIHG